MVTRPYRLGDTHTSAEYRRWFVGAARRANFGGSFALGEVRRRTRRLRSNTDHRLNTVGTARRAMKYPLCEYEIRLRRMKSASQMKYLHRWCKCYGSFATQSSFIENGKAELFDLVGDTPLRLTPVVVSQLHLLPRNCSRRGNPATPRFVSQIGSQPMCIRRWQRVLTYGMV